MEWGAGLPADKGPKTNYAKGAKIFMPGGSAMQSPEFYVGSSRNRHFRKLARAISRAEQATGFCPGR